MEKPRLLDSIGQAAIALSRQSNHLQRRNNPFINPLDAKFTRTHSNISLGEHLLTPTSEQAKPDRLNKRRAPRIPLAPKPTKTKQASVKIANQQKPFGNILNRFKMPAMPIFKQRKDKSQEKPRSPSTLDMIAKIK